VASGWLEGKKVVDRNYLNVFPTLFLRYAQNDKKSYVLSLTSRINRPSFWDLNPFRTYTTDDTYFEGNPFLLPSKYYRQELNHTLDSKSGTYTFQFAASQLLDEFYALPFNPERNVIANQKINYGNRYSFSTTTTYYNQIKPWWRFSGTALANYVMTKGNANKIIIDTKTLLISLSANQTFTLSKQKAISLTVIANNTFPFTIINTEVNNRLETELRLRKTIGNLNMTVSVQDLFRGNQDRYRRPVNDIFIVENYYNDTRSIGFALNYNFGSKTVKDKRERDTGNADEKGRV
jgi:Outer membrane protein beta-barrel family